MKNKTQLVCTISLLLGAVIVIAINFSAGWMGDKPQSVNIAATAFYLLFWVLMLRFKPAVAQKPIMEPIIVYRLKSDDAFAAGLKRSISTQKIR